VIHATFDVGCLRLSKSGVCPHPSPTAVQDAVAAFVGPQAVESWERLSNNCYGTCDKY
jgi:hypothetical protein